MTKWKLEAGRVYISTDGQYMIKNVGYKSWGLFINDGTSEWHVDWVGSVYPTVGAAQSAVDKSVAS